MRASAGRSEAGGAAVELTLVTPLLLVLLLFVVALGRFGVARGDVDGAARDAARAASLRRTPSGLDAVARHAAAASLGGRDVTCRGGPAVAVSSDFRPGGWVAVDVWCVVDLADVALLRLPGTKTLSSRFVAPIETYRGLS